MDTTPSAERGGPTPADRRPWRKSPILAVVALLALWRLGLAAFLPYDRFIALFDDDAFYYFGIARHIADGSGSTFNGIDPTNGYHPGWLMVIEPVFYLSHGRAALVGITVVSCLLFMVFGVILEQISREIGSATVVLISAAPILAVSVVGPSYFFSGMETGLAIVAVSATGLFCLRTGGFSPAAATPRNAVILGLLMSFSIAARLDTVVTMVLIGLAVMWRWRGKLMLALGVAAIPTAFLVAYAAVNLAVFHTATPVSGQAKALGDTTNMGVFEQFLAAPKIFGFDSLLGLAAAPITVAAVVVAVRRPRPGHAESAAFGATLYLGSLCTVAYYGLTSSWQLWPWYFYAIPLALVFSLIPLVDHLARARAATVLAVLSTASVLSLAAVWSLEQATSTDSRSAFVSAAPEVAELIDRLDPAGSPIAIGDRAGSIGYHLGRPTVQLEGLVNSKEFLEALEGGDVGSFLNDRDVRLYARVDAASGELTPEGLRRFMEPQQGYGPRAGIYVRDSDLVLSFPLPDGTTYRVWRYRPEINSG